MHDHCGGGNNIATELFIANRTVCNNNNNIIPGVFPVANRRQKAIKTRRRRAVTGRVVPTSSPSPPPPPPRVSDDGDILPIFHRTVLFRARFSMESDDRVINTGGKYRTSGAK